MLNVVAFFVNLVKCLLMADVLTVKKENFSKTSVFEILEER